MPNDFTTHDAIAMLFMSMETGQPLTHLCLFFGYSYAAVSSRICRARRLGFDAPYLPHRGAARIRGR